MNLLISAHQKIINRFYKLSVPDGLLDIHKKEIALLTQQKSFFEKVRDIQTDPLAAILAADSIKKVNGEFDNLNSNIISFIQTNKLTVQWE